MKRKKIKVRLKSDSPTEQATKASLPTSSPQPVTNMQRFRPPHLPTPNLTARSSNNFRPHPPPRPHAPPRPLHAPPPMSSARRMVGLPRLRPPAGSHFAPPFFRPGMEMMVGPPSMPYSEAGSGFDHNGEGPLLPTLRVDGGEVAQHNIFAAQKSPLSYPPHDPGLPPLPYPPFPGAPPTLPSFPYPHEPSMFHSMNKNNNHGLVSPLPPSLPPSLSHPSLFSLPLLRPAKPDEPPPVVEEVWPPPNWVAQSLNSERVLFGGLVGYLAKGTWVPTRVCFTCSCPIAIFGWLTPCRHLYCLSCADFMKKSDKCGRCSSTVNKVESMDFDEDAAAMISECPVSDCVQAFFDQTSLQNHLSSAHPRFIRPPAPVLPPQNGEIRADSRNKNDTSSMPLLHPVTEKDNRHEHHAFSVDYSHNSVNKTPLTLKEELNTNKTLQSGETLHTGQKRPRDEESPLLSGSDSAHSTLTNSKALSESLDTYRTDVLDRTHQPLASEQSI